jgi:hypothetical protein
MRVYVGLAVAAVLGFAGLAQATPLDLKQISADAKVAAHLDVDGLLASKGMAKVREQVLKEHPQIESGLAMLRTMWRFDPTTDLHGITIYSTQLKKDTGVVIIRAKVDQKFMLDMVKMAPEHKVTQHGKYELHSWLKDGKKQENATFYQPDVLVFGNSLTELQDALGVLDGTKPNITATTHISADALPPGSIFTVGIRELSGANVPLESPLAKQVESALLIVGENQNQVFVRGALTMKQAEIVKQIKTVADGALAFASLARMDDADALKLIAAVKVTAADKVVSLEAQASVDDVWAQIQKEHARKKAEMEHHSGRRVHFGIK